MINSNVLIIKIPTFNDKESSKSRQVLLLALLCDRKSDVFKMAISSTVCFAGFIITLIVCSSANDEAQCYSYAGGTVFPQETRRTTGHATQWSQAVS